jgi:hypothetical protein
MARLQSPNLAPLCSPVLVAGGTFAQAGSEPDRCATQPRVLWRAIQQDQYSEFPRDSVANGSTQRGQYRFFALAGKPFPTTNLDETARAPTRSRSPRRPAVSPTASSTWT